MCLSSLYVRYNDEAILSQWVAPFFLLKSMGGPFLPSLVFTLQIHTDQAQAAISKTLIGKSTFDFLKVDAQAAWTPRL